MKRLAGSRKWRKRKKVGWGVFVSETKIRSHLGRRKMANITMTVNGKSVSGEVEGRTLLVDFLRTDLRLTGMRIVGCDT